MNLFLPENGIFQSLRDLDDKRLNKQILECKVILDVSYNLSTAYQYHPVVVYYKDYPGFVIHYATMACDEYRYRRRKFHDLVRYFNDLYTDHQPQNESPSKFYCENAKWSPYKIRTTDKHACELFRLKLSYKWSNSKATWTRRQCPNWYYDCITTLKSYNNNKVPECDSEFKKLIYEIHQDMIKGDKS